MKKSFFNLIKVILITSILITLSVSCTGKKTDITDQTNTPSPIIKETATPKSAEQSLKIASGMTVEERFKVPEGYKRTETLEGSFEEYLRTLPLKADGSKVHYYNGRVKNKTGVHDAVIDIDVGNRDLQQCADAVMRLRAEYLYKEGRYNDIHFDFLNGMKVDYSKWMQGGRIAVEGNSTYWVNRADPSNTYDDFRNYMDTIFTYANTVSLLNEMQAVKVSEMKIGDVFIDSGHSVIVVDMALNEEKDKKLFILAQSYMPAQDIHILKNPENEDISPWYELDFGSLLITPEWVFKKGDLRRFNESDDSHQQETSNEVENTKTKVTVTPSCETEKDGNILSGKIICIDPGHQSKPNFEKELLAPGSNEKKIKDPGGTSGVSTGKPEYVLNLEVSLKLRDKLDSIGAKVVMTRESHDVDIGNIKRAQIANECNADLFLRIHADGSNNSSINGISILVPGNKYINDSNMLQKSKTSAGLILNGMVDETGARSRGLIERNDITGFNWSKVPVMLIEMGFMSNPDEDKLLSTEDYQMKIVEGIVEGIEKYFEN